MGITKFMFQYNFAVAETLNFVCQDIEAICQDSCEFLIVEVVGWHVAWRRKRRLREFVEMQRVMEDLESKSGTSARSLQYLPT
jgi:hypothetical protein